MLLPFLRNFDYFLKCATFKKIEPEQMIQLVLFCLSHFFRTFVCPFFGMKEFLHSVSGENYTLEKVITYFRFSRNPAK